MLVVVRLRLVGSSPSTRVLLEAGAALGCEVEAGVSEEGARRSGDAVVVVDADGAHRDAIGLACDLARVSQVVVVGSGLETGAVARLFAAGCRDVVEAPLHKRELILRLAAVLQQKLRVTCIGGGSGLFAALSAIKDVPRVLLTSVVTMSDDGGSSGRLRTSFGVLPPGDVRRSLVALSNAPEVMSFVMQYRFDVPGDGLAGHSLGNLLLAALADKTGGMQNAVKALGDVLNVQGIVKCVTESSTTLVAETVDGQVVRGESAIDQCLERSGDVRLRRVWHEPAASASPDVVASILAADVVLVGPGDLYTSVLASLLVGGVAEAVRETKAQVVYVCNLMTKPGETSGYDVADHVRAVVEGLGGDVLDWVLASGTSLEAEAVAGYAALGQHPVGGVTPEAVARATGARFVLADVGDQAKLVRHDPLKLRAELVQILRAVRPSLAAE